MIDPATVIRKSPRAEYRSLGDGEGGVVLHLDTAAYHGVNGGGALVWSLIEGVTFGELIAELRVRLQDPPAELEADIEGFIDALAEHDLVLLGDPPGESDPA
jgi:hypothetical protein